MFSSDDDRWLDYFVARDPSGPVCLTHAALQIDVVVGFSLLLLAAGILNWLECDFYLPVDFQGCGLFPGGFQLCGMWGLIDTPALMNHIVVVVTIVF